ncbi:MAG TPA: hypothetical protein VKT99_05595 [Xanthobacteraceae bacterium]|jgi:hypothetical protein|nr:hypothetical protein [Xanthobacteraceae bacterium]
MEIPESALKPMRDGHAAYQRLLARQTTMHQRWQKGQLEDLTLLVEIMSATHNALKRRIDANPQD